MSNSSTHGAGDPFVSFQNVDKSYDGEVLAVRDLNLDIAAGEFLTLLGPSGSGKTTSLMMLAGFEAVTRGGIVLDGRSITDVPPHERGIGMVFQNYALFPHMSVTENVAFPLHVRRMAKRDIEDRVARALGMVELGDLADRRPAQLSGGQQQRVAVARALVFDPALVLMDEPLGALDKQLREQMQFEIKRIHRDLGVTVVYVTHDQSEALTMSDRIAVFENGTVQQVSTPTDLYERPNTSFVAQFVGENNRLDGRVIGVDRETCRVQLTTGDSVVARRVNVSGSDVRTTLSLRPERVVIDPGADVANRMEGRVLEAIYLGDHIRTRMHLAGSDEFIIKLPNSAGNALPVEGSTVTVGWHARDCMALDVYCPEPAHAR